MSVSIFHHKAGPRWSDRVVFVALLFAATAAFSQVSTRISSIAPGEAFSNAPITVRAELAQGEEIEQVYLVYRAFGESGYQRLEMDLVGNTASSTLPSSAVVPPFVEYYIVLVHRTGVLETYPLSETADPFASPPEKTLFLPVRSAEERESQIVFLSPEPMSTLSPEDILISISLLRADSIVVRQATQIFLDGADVTADALFSGDIIVYAPENLALQLSPGVHRVAVRLYNREGNLHSAGGLTFTVRGQGFYAVPEPITSQLAYRGFVQFESRREQVRSVGTWYNRAGYQVSGTRGEWRFLSNAFVTSDEKENRQPQNRLFVGIEHSLFRAGYGDAYPAFPNLILSGKRIRGLHAALTLGGFNVDVTLGKTARAVEGSLLKAFPVDSLLVEQLRDPAAPYGPIDERQWGKFSYGTYARNLFAIHPSVGSGETWQLGLSYMHSRDDMGSIRYGTRPQENLVVGTDFLARFDQRRIEITGQGAFSAYNSDISSGPATDAYIDSTFKDQASRDAIRKVRDILGSFITVNDNLRPLSLKRPSTLAYDLALGLKYFDNVFRFTYVFRGSDYNSFGQSFIRKDIRGFTIVDRARLFDNHAFLSLGYEHLRDNTSDVKVATTSFNNVTVALSYYSWANYLSVTVGYARFSNANGLSSAGHDSLSVVDDVTNRVFLQSSYSFDLGASHTAALNISTSSRNDRSLRQLDVHNTTLALGLTTRYRVPLQTGFDVAINLNKLPAGRGIQETLNYTSISANVKYAILRDILTCTATLSPTVGDFRRTVLDLGSEWFALPTMSLLLQFSYFKNDGVPNDNFISLRYRYDI